MKVDNCMNSLLTNLIPQKFKVGQKFYLETRVQKAISVLIFNEFQQMRAHNLRGRYSIDNTKL